MHITAIKSYSHAHKKLCRFGLADALFDLQQVLLDIDVVPQFHFPLVSESPRLRISARVIRDAIDVAIANNPKWKRTNSAGINWLCEIRSGDTYAARLGMQSVVAARKDLLISRILRMRNILQNGMIDVGVIIVPSDRMRPSMSSRCLAFSDVVRVVEHELPEASRVPIVLMAVELGARPHERANHSLVNPRRTDMKPNDLWREP